MQQPCVRFPFPTPDMLRRDPAAQAFLLLRIAFVVAPILFGLDKFAEVMISDWPKYLAPEFNGLIPGSAQDAMYIVGAVEIVAGLVVAIAPRFGGLLVAGWLGGIIVSLLLVGGYADIALRDFGLLIGALALSRLASGELPSHSFNGTRTLSAEKSPASRISSAAFAKARDRHQGELAPHADALTAGLGDLAHGHAGQGEHVHRLGDRVADGADLLGRAQPAARRARRRRRARRPAAARSCRRGRGCRGCGSRRAP